MNLFLFFLFFLRFCRTWTKRDLITSQTRVKRVSQIPRKKGPFGLAARNLFSLSLPLSLSSSSHFLSFSKQKFSESLSPGQTLESQNFYKMFLHIHARSIAFQKTFASLTKCAVAESFFFDIMRCMVSFSTLRLILFDDQCCGSLPEVQ